MRFGYFLALIVAAGLAISPMASDACSLMNGGGKNTNGDKVAMSGKDVKDGKATGEKSAHENCPMSPCPMDASDCQKSNMTKTPETKTKS